MFLHRSYFVQALDDRLRVDAHEEIAEATDNAHVHKEDGATVVGSHHLSQRSEHAWHSIGGVREETSSWWWKGAL